MPFQSEVPMTIRRDEIWAFFLALANLVGSSKKIGANCIVANHKDADPCIHVCNQNQ